MTAAGLELRFAPEVRMAGRTLSGVACPFNRPATIRSNGGTFREILAPGCFAESLRSNADISALADHDGRALLGRTRSGSLKLSETAAGLEYSLDLPSTSVGDDICSLASRGELAGCSVGFVIPKGGESWTENTRTLTAVTLHHVAIITGGDPAYSGTTANLRHARHLVHGDALRRRRWMATL